MYIHIFINVVVHMNRIDIRQTTAIQTDIMQHILPTRDNQRTPKTKRTSEHNLSRYFEAKMVKPN